MNVDKIARLFAAQSEPARFQQKTITNNVANPILTDSEAVKLGLNTDSQSRADKVARLKEAVQDGSYNPDSREVAAAVYKELLI